MSFLAFFPAACFCLTVYLFYRGSEAPSWRRSFLYASIVLGLFTVLTTELLSLLNWIVFPGVLLSWLGAFMFLLGTGSVSSAGSGGRFSWRLPKDWLSRMLIIGVLLYVLTTGLIALVAPPNTWDSLEYHMPKVAHWIQNQSVDFYPTAIPRQNHQNPGAEYFILHLHLLAGSDRFANLVEWFAMLGSLFSVSLIAKFLGSKKSGQWLAALFVVSLPMGIMQASSTQTDYVIAFWLSCFVYFALRLMRSDRLEWAYLLALSGALGLSLLTKATTYLYATPFLIWMTLSLFRSHRFRMVRPLLVFAVIVLIINGPHLIRNYQLHGNPLGPGEEPTSNSKYSNDLFTPAVLISNTSRNLAIHTQTPWASVNDLVEESLKGLHQLIGLDVNDRRTTWGPPEWVQFSIRETTFHDEIDGNPLHLLLSLCCLGLMIGSSRLRKRRDLVLYTLCVVAAFLAFSLFIKWSPWNSRVHMAVFVLAGPFCGTVLATLLSCRVTKIFGLVLLLSGVPWLLYGDLRPLAGEENIFNTSRIELFFRNPAPDRPLERYLEAADFLKERGVERVGLILTNSSWEYVWWVLLQDPEKIRFEHVNVTDPSSRIQEEEPFVGFRPDAVISSVPETSARPVLVVEDLSYERRWIEEDLAIFLAESSQ